MRKLFLSYTGLLMMLRDGKVESTDLDNALFYFGCTRSHVFGPIEKTEAAAGPPRGYFSDNPELGRQLHELIKQAIEKGEAEGRVVWRLADGWNDYDDLNELLERNGYKTVFPESCRTNYTYPGATDLVIAANPNQLEPMWR